jgi:hypothetical protein
MLPCEGTSLEEFSAASEVVPFQRSFSQQGGIGDSEITD